MSFRRKFPTYHYLLMVSAICTLIMLLPEHYRIALYLDFDQACGGEYWRYITGHFVHYSWLHYISNLLGLALLTLLFNQSDTSIDWYRPTLFVLSAISIGLAISSKQLSWYVGYSGMLTGLLSYTCIKTFSDNAILSFTFLLFITTYVAAQTILGGELIASTLLTGIHTSSYAHLFGLMAGCIYGLLEQLRNYLIHFQNNH